jgi:hypothetical protein
VRLVKDASISKSSCLPLSLLLFGALVGFKLDNFGAFVDVELGDFGALVDFKLGTFVLFTLFDLGAFIDLDPFSFRINLFS